MRYLLHWTCEHCQRQQHTQLSTGDKWPQLCLACNDRVKDLVTRDAVQPTAANASASQRRVGVV